MNELTTSTPYLSLMQAVVEKGTDLSQLEKLLDMQTKWEANEAKKAYVKAMAEFKANAPTLIKDKKAHNSNYANLAQVAGKVAETMGKFGLSHSWSTSQEGNTITVACVITHEQGHSESVSLSASPDTSGSKNAIQAIGSAVTYLQRYTLLAATGLAAYDQDDDGAKSSRPPVQLITEAQVQEIERLATENGVNTDKILKAYGLADLSEISADRFESVVNRLKASGGK